MRGIARLLQVLSVALFFSILWAKAPGQSALAQRTARLA